ncbi:MAG TPA: AMP-binding protein, partial [Casimicrobiaceae bacterium]
KGVVYSHRSSLMHALGAGLPDCLGVANADTILPVVPMFHANAWGLPYAAALAGAGLVFPGPHLDPESVLGLLADEGVTMTAGVPTVWLGLLGALDAEPDRWDLSRLRRLIVGGAAVPESLMRGFDAHGLRVVQAWGMTETSPLGTVCHPDEETATTDAGYAYRTRQGIAVPLVEIRARGELDELIPWDDESQGELEVRGPWIAAAYHGGEGADKFTSDGWFQTGDIVSIDRHGCVKIRDRAKDLVKSGGEWISSVEMENLLMAHPAIAEAAVIAVPDERWGERPLAVIVLADGCQASDGELREHLSGDFARWQLPERFEVIDAIPRTATGKWKKTALRERFIDGAATSGVQA